MASGYTVHEILRFFNFFKMAATAIWIFKISKFQSEGQEGENASAFQILSKSVKPFLRYGDFRFFEMAAATILDF